MILFVDSEGPDQPAWMRKLTCAFPVRICKKTRFRMAQPIKQSSKSPEHIFVYKLEKKMFIWIIWLLKRCHANMFWLTLIMLNTLRCHAHF